MYDDDHDDGEAQLRRVCIREVTRNPMNRREIGRDYVREETLSLRSALASPRRHVTGIRRWRREKERCHGVREQMEELRAQQRTVIMPIMSNNDVALLFTDSQLSLEATRRSHRAWSRSRGSNDPVHAPHGSHSA